MKIEIDKRNTHAAFVLDMRSWEPANNIIFGFLNTAFENGWFQIIYNEDQHATGEILLTRHPRWEIKFL